MTTPPVAAPAVVTRPAAERAADAAAEVKAETMREPTTVEKKRMLSDQIRALEALEARERLGARDLTPKQRLMDFTKLENANPDRHYRWLNTSNDSKMEGRRIEGYVPVTEEEAKAVGVRHRLGEMVLASIPKERAEARRARQERITADRMGAGRAEMEQQAEALSRHIYDTTGKRIDPKRFITTEER